MFELADHEQSSYQEYRRVEGFHVTKEQALNLLYADDMVIFKKNRVQMQAIFQLYTKRCKTGSCR